MELYGMGLYHALNYNYTSLPCSPKLRGSYHSLRCSEVFTTLSELEVSTMLSEVPTPYQVPTYTPYHFSELDDGISSVRVCSVLNFTEIFPKQWGVRTPCPPCGYGPER